MVVDMPDVGVAAQQAARGEAQILRQLSSLWKFGVRIFQGLERLGQRRERIAGGGGFAREHEQIDFIAQRFNRPFDHARHPAGAQVVMNYNNC